MILTRKKQTPIIFLLFALLMTATVFIPNTQPVLAAPTASGDSSNPSFRIISVTAQYGQLIVEAQHFYPDSDTHWFFEDYTFQGREAHVYPRSYNIDGRWLMDDGTEAPGVYLSEKEYIQYLPDGRDWMYDSEPSLDNESILSVIEATHQERIISGWTHGEQRLTTTPLDFTDDDETGAESLKNQFSFLEDSAYTIIKANSEHLSEENSDVGYVAPLPYYGYIPPADMTIGPDWGTVSTFYSTQLDGYVVKSYSYGDQKSWATIHTGTGTHALENQAFVQLQIKNGPVADTWLSLYRSFLLFDTSAIPDSDVISSATFEAVATVRQDTLTPAGSIRMVTSTPASDSTLATSDYTNIATVAQAPDTTLASLTVDSSTYNVLTLNATGLGNISKTGISKFGLRLVADADNSEPTWGSYVKIADLKLAAANEVISGDKRARLVVTHGAPSAEVSGTIGDGATEQEVRDGGGTIIITTQFDSWVAAGATFDAQRQNIIDGLDAADAQTNGWNAQVRDQLGVSSVVRTSDTVVTITIPADDVSDYHIATNEVITTTVPSTAVNGGGALTATPTTTITAAVESAAITGTIGDGATEQEVRDGGGTILITLTNTKWVAAGGTFDGQRQNIIDGLDAADAQAAGWNAEVRDKIGVSSVVRTSDTLVTITISADDVSAYNITTNEVITVTVPVTAILYSGGALTATPTFTIVGSAESVALTGTISDGATTTEIKAGGETAIITLTNTTWVASGSTFNAQRQNIINGFVSASSDANGWNNRRADFPVTDVVRTSDTVVTVTFSASSNFAIGATETITLTVPASAIVHGTALVATPTFAITPRFATSGTWISPAINLSSVSELIYCSIGWEQTTPSNTSVTMEYSIDGGSNYTTATNGSCPLTLNSSQASITDFRIKASLGTTDNTVTPSVTSLGFIAGNLSGQTLRYQLNTTPALTITDRTGNGHSGTMSFPAQPTGLDTTVGSMTAIRDATTAQINLGIPQMTSPVTGAAVSDNLFNLDETGWAELPGYDIINSMSTAGDGLPIQFVWYIFLGFLIIMGGFFALNLTQSLFAAAATMGVGIGAALAIGGGLMPGWVIFVFIPIAIGLIFLRPRLAI